MTLIKTAKIKGIEKEEIYQRLKTDILEELDKRVFGLKNKSEDYDSLLNSFSEINSEFLNKLSYDFSEQIKQNIKNVLNSPKIKFQIKEKIYNHISNKMNILSDKYLDKFFDEIIKPEKNEIIKKYVEKIRENILKNDYDLYSEFEEKINSKIMMKLEKIQDNFLDKQFEKILNLKENKILLQYIEKIKENIYSKTMCLSPEFNRLLNKILIELDIGDKIMKDSKKTWAKINEK